MSVCIHRHTCLHICLQTWLPHIYTHAHTHVYTHARSRLGPCLHTCLHMRLHTCLHTSKHTSIPHSQHEGTRAVQPTLRRTRHVTRLGGTCRCISAITRRRGPYSYGRCISVMAITEMSTANSDQQQRHRGDARMVPVNPPHVCARTHTRASGHGPWATGAVGHTRHRPEGRRDTRGCGARNVAGRAQGPVRSNVRGHARRRARTRGRGAGRRAPWSQSGTRCIWLHGQLRPPSAPPIWLWPI